MKRTLSALIFSLLAIALVITGCAPVPPAVTSEPEPQPSEPPEIVATEPDSVPVRFTIQAAPDVQAAIIALYLALFPDELPSFVSMDADLLVAPPVDTPFTPSPLPATFLPGLTLIPQSDSEGLAAFIDFATSPEGQVVLIDAGFLPSTVTLTDQSGSTVTLPQPIRTLVSTYGPATAMVYAVDAESVLVAASYLGARDPLGAAAMTRIDPRFEDLVSDDYFSQDNFNVEEAASLAPDLILTSVRTAWLETAAELGIPAFLYEAETSELLQEAILLTGNLFGPNAAAQAEAWVAYYNWIKASLREQTASIPVEDRPRVLFTGTQPTRVASGDMYQTSMIEIAGGVSVSAELSGYWNDVNLEQIALWDPDIIIVPPYGGATVAAITEAPEWQLLSAVQAGRVYQMPKLVVPWDTPAPDSVLGIVWLSQRLFPELAPLDCAEQADYFYQTYYDYAISPEELDIICRID